MRKGGFFFFLLFSLLLFLRPIRGFIHFFLLHSLYLPIIKIQKTFTDLLYLSEERDRLLKENINLRLLLKKNEEVSSIQNPEKKIILANVISFSPLGVPEGIVVDKGRKKGVEEDGVVIFEGSLVGKVTEVEENTSSALTLYSPKLRVGVLDKRSKILGILYGGKEIEIRYVPSEADVRVGDTIITSGIGGIYPKGLPVGVVVSVRKKEQFFQLIKIKPFMKFYRLSRVAILLRE